MKQSHILFNVVGLVIAGIFSVSALGQLQGNYPGTTLLWTGLIILLVGGGSLSNLTGRGLAVGPTVTMIIGYVISVFLIPLGIWGVIALISERKRQRRRQRP